MWITYEFGEMIACADERRNWWVVECLGEEYRAEDKADAVKKMRDTLIAAGWTEQSADEWAARVPVTVPS